MHRRMEWTTLACCVFGVRLRTMVLAHQRRGESDFVAHWLYQLMALDAGAQEWEHVLR